MNKTKIQSILSQWTALIKHGERVSIKKANESPGGLRGRIKRTTGKPVIFDLQTYERQQAIQNSLSQELPKLTELINSQPEIMDGHSWFKEDFIDLYFKHFSLVVEKLQRIIDKEAGV